MGRIEVFYIDAETKEQHRSEHTDPLTAAQAMGTVETYDNLVPAGWTWDSDETRDRVLSIRRGRDYPDLTHTLY